MYHSGAQMNVPMRAASRMKKHISRLSTSDRDINNLLKFEVDSWQIRDKTGLKTKLNSLCFKIAIVVNRNIKKYKNTSNHP